MQEFFNCLFSTNGMAYGTGVLIFLLTLFLASRQVIGFTLHTPFFSVCSCGLIWRREQRSDPQLF